MKKTIVLEFRSFSNFARLIIVYSSENNALVSHSAISLGSQRKEGVWRNERIRPSVVVYLDGYLRRQMSMTRKEFRMSFRKTFGPAKSAFLIILMLIENV